MVINLIKISQRKYNKLRHVKENDGQKPCNDESTLTSITKAPM